MGKTGASQSEAFAPTGAEKIQFIDNHTSTPLLLKTDCFT